MSEQIFLRCAMNVDASVESIPIAGFHPLQPENARHNWVAAGGIRLEDFASRLSGMEDLTERLTHADFHPDKKLSEGRGVAAQTVADPEPRG